MIDIKPENMEDLAEVITYSRFHPTENSVFAFSSSKGVIRLCDMRRSTHHEQHAKRKKKLKNYAIQKLLKNNLNSSFKFIFYIILNLKVYFMSNNYLKIMK